MRSLRKPSFAHVLALTLLLTACTDAADVPDAPARASTPSAQAAPEASALEAPFPEGVTQKVTRADATEWMPCPPTLPEGCRMAVLEGNPQAAGLFTMRIRTDQPFEMAAHTHPAAERVTVLEGEISVGFGEAFDRNQGQIFRFGDFYVNASNTAHYVWADGPVLIQITGLGPWQANYLDAAP